MPVEVNKLVIVITTTFQHDSSPQYEWLGTGAESIPDGGWSGATTKEEPGMQQPAVQPVCSLCKSAAETSLVNSGL